MDGILLFNKPILWTSHDAVDYVRRQVGQKSVGHAGTLDPMATGLLVMLLGKATKLSQFLCESDKDYAGTFLFGIETDSQDLEGRIIREMDCSQLSEEKIVSVCSQMTGAIQQLPPKYSAVKKNGKNLYQWARKGIVVEVEPREVKISKLVIHRVRLPEAEFFLSCSKGTYVRTLCDEIGKQLGVVASLSSLVRLRSGEFDLRAALDAKTLASMPPESLEKKLIQKDHESLSRVCR